MKITASVGRSGVNRRADVERVQEALNRTILPPLALLKVDGMVGSRTIISIEQFQRRELNFLKPDALIEVNGKTWAALSAFLTEPTSQAKSLARLLSYQTNTPKPVVTKLKKIAWGAKVSPGFKAKVVQICDELGVSPDFLMACMAFETGETFSPNIKNAAGSGAIGLIQFMPRTAKGLGTTTESLQKMTDVDQLDYVKKYFLPYRNKLKSLEDIYMAILYPAAIGKPADYSLFKEGTVAYDQNKGFDSDKDGKISLTEISIKVREKYTKGLQSGYIG